MNKLREDESMMRGWELHDNDTVNEFHQDDIYQNYIQLQFK